MMYDLPDGTSVSIGSERYLVTESYFSPSLVSDYITSSNNNNNHHNSSDQTSEVLSVPEMICRSIFSHPSLEFVRLLPRLI